MKKYLLLFGLLSFSFSIYAQVGINTNQPNINSILHASESIDGSVNGVPTIFKGLIIPRYSNTERDNNFPSLGNEDNGLLIYNTDTDCYNYWSQQAFSWLEICGVTTTTNPTIGEATINCAGSTLNGVLTANQAASGVTVSIPYTNGNGGNYNSQSISSTDVTGLTASISAGSFSNGSGNLEFNIIGTPDDDGLANFNLNMGGTTCTFSVEVQAAPGMASINCASASATGTLTAGQTASGVTVSISYTGGNGGTYEAQSYNSFGINGLTATIGAGSFNDGPGNLVFNVNGTPSSSGTASFNLNMGGTSCEFKIAVQSNNAVFTGPTVCNASIVYRNNGTHLMLNKLATSQTIEYPVNVSQAGVWSVTTSTLEGLTFSGSGTFASTGTQLITLTASGTPTRAGTIIYDIPGSSIKFKVPVGNETITVLKTDQASHANDTNSGFPTKTNLANNGFLRLDARRAAITGDTFFPIVSVLVGTVNSVAANISYNALSVENTYGGSANRNYTTVNAGQYFGYEGSGGTADLDDGLGHYRYESNPSDNTRMNETTILTHDGLEYTVYAKWKPRSTTTYETTLRVTPRNSVISGSCQ